MNYAVKLTSEAKQELDAAMGWYADRDTEVAVEWYLGFMNAIRSLSENPQRHGLAFENDNFPFDIHALLYGSGKRLTHRAVFRIADQTVEVLTIRHTAQRELKPEDLPTG
jgi:plasmid stabilization system protein ParE